MQQKNFPLCPLPLEPQHIPQLGTAIPPILGCLDETLLSVELTW